MLKETAAVVLPVVMVSVLPAATVGTLDRLRSATSTEVSLVTVAEIPPLLVESQTPIRDMLETLPAVG